jgi:hypothetical protein
VVTVLGGFWLYPEKVLGAPFLKNFSCFGRKCQNNRHHRHHPSPRLVFGLPMRFLW